MKTMQNRKGIIALVTLLILAAVGVLGIAMVVTSQLNYVAANNYRHKLQTYYAADGVLTLLAQDVLDFNDSCYGVNTLIEAEDTKYSSQYILESKTIASNGKLIKIQNSGQTGTDSFNFSEPTGTYDVKVTYFDEGDGKSIYKVYINSSLIDTLCADQTPTSGSGDPDATTKKVWTIANVSIANGDMFKIKGTANSSEWARVDCIEFAAAGLGDSTSVGAIPVKFALVKLGSNLFRMTSDAYKLTGVTGRCNYETRLNQVISRETEGQWHLTAQDSAEVPVTLYEFKSDLSNPEFNVKAFINDASDQPLVAHFIQNQIGPDRKPQLKKDLTGFREALLSLYVSSGIAWYYQDSCKRVKTMNGVSNSQRRGCLSGSHTAFSWDFCDSIHKWFRPSGATGAVFDTATGKWSNLKNRPKYNSTTHAWSDVVPDEWVGMSYDSTDDFANIVIYDTLTFREKSGQPGVFIFGDETKIRTNKLDTQWFVLDCNQCCSASCKTGKMACAADTENSFFSSPEMKYMPLKNRGFKYQDVRYIPKSIANNCVKSTNWAFTMEIHRKFSYKSDQTFIFRGDDDVWVFVNNQLVIDLGGVHGAVKDSVALKDLGLTEGQEYDFDMFYCERCVYDSNILITTNMMFWIPPQPLKRSWKRDYGPLD